MERGQTSAFKPTPRKLVGHTGAVLALDDTPATCREACLEELVSMFGGIKVGLPLLLRKGPDFLKELSRIAGRYDALRIADFKLADVGDVMVTSLEATRALGYDAVIAHAFVGVRGGLDLLVKRAEELGIKVILVTSMSHEGSKEFYDKHFEEFLVMARDLGAWGVVAPATRPWLITRARAALGASVKILSPGVGAQGASFGTALCAGANYEIVGRSVVKAEDPLRAARMILERMEVVRRSCTASSA